MPTQSRRTVLAGTATAAALTAHAAEPQPQAYRRRHAVIAGTGSVTGVLSHPGPGDATGLVQAAQPLWGVRTGWGDHAIGACSHDARRTGAPSAAHSVIARKTPGATATDGRGIRYGDPVR
ncbi:hypothetical protein [Streptomyces shenzhenensis]|uniref:hypothetical protein n=1 Tax=Streptomyces shenzhenensis TaxID=943815 RepID=UPI001F475CC8|nr:hypothetical protein [Streptomyces shenzhenensis]